MSTRALLLPRLALLGVVALLASLAVASPAAAEEVLAPAVPHWHLETRVAPTSLQREGEGSLNGEGMIVDTAINLGDAAATAGQTLVDKLPKGVEAVEVLQASEGLGKASTEQKGFTCSKKKGPEVECTRTLGLPAYGQLELQIQVKVSKDAPSESANELTISGGGSEVPPLVEQVHVGAHPSAFEVEHFSMTAENENFEPDVQAGSHPFQLTTSFDLTDAYEAENFLPHEKKPSEVHLSRNLSFRLPPGLIGNANVVGNPNAVQQCSAVDFGTLDQEDDNLCPNDTVVGVASVTTNVPNNNVGYKPWVVPIDNLEPEKGEPARFGFTIAAVPVILETKVRTGEDYGVTVSVYDASQQVQVLSSTVTFWGVPGDPRHNPSRNSACLGYTSVVPCEPSFKVPAPAPFLMMPASCETLNTSVEGEAWDGSKLDGGGATEGEAPAMLKGCEELPFKAPFNPTIEVSPDSHEASTPTGLTVKVNVPQQTTLESRLDGAGVEEQDIRSTTLELPAELQSSPALASALGPEGTCSSGDIGLLEGLAEGAQLENNDLTSAPANCPKQSQIGTVDIVTPLLHEHLTGAVYLAKQGTNPFAPPLVLYMVAKEPTSETLVKLAGEVKINPANGQLVSVFRNTPQTPFETLTLHLDNSARSAQSTPAHCGEYHATARFATWSGIEEEANSNPAEFAITSGPGGTPCPGAQLPFAPGFSAGSVNTGAGAYTPFVLTIEKPDGQQALQSITAQLPPGLAAKIASVTPCADTAAIEALPLPDPSPPPCGPESEIGETVTESGLGSEPVSLKGKLFLTKGVDGAPFGLLASTEAKTGPFDLGWVNILSTVSVNEETAAVTTKSVTAIPQRLDGVPVQLKKITVNVNREGFEFNPTNCTRMEVTGSLGGWEGASDPVSAPFQAANCPALGFKPDFKAYTEGHTSKEGGASLRVVIDYPKGYYANIAKSVTYLPYDLPSRLKPTIQHACPDYDFNPNTPQTCDPDSLVGHAIVHTPVFKNPLEGPAYLVSHANRSFPDIYIILHEPESGLKIVLDGHTDIKNGITKTSFESTPDAPIETFELILPEGPHSALAANGNLCDETKTVSTRKKETRIVKGKKKKVTVTVKTTVPEKLILPTTLTGQNGNVIEQQTPIVVEGCPKVVVKASKTKKKPTKKPKKKK